jgi:hypothetical protein
MGCVTYLEYTTEMLTKTPIKLTNFPSARVYRPGYKFPFLVATFDHSDSEIERNRYYQWGVYEDVVPTPLIVKAPTHNSKSLLNPPPEKGDNYNVSDLIDHFNKRSDPNVKKVYFYTGCRYMKEPELHDDVRERSDSQQSKL